MKFMRWTTNERPEAGTLEERVSLKSEKNDRYGQSHHKLLFSAMMKYKHTIIRVEKL